MKVALIGASGFIGSGLLTEALARGHHVKALVGHPERIAAQENLSVVQADVMDLVSLTGHLQREDAVITAFSGHAQTNVAEYYVTGIRSIIAATRAAGVKRLLVVGGAGSLEVASGLQLLDSPDFPEPWKASALGAREALNILRRETQLEWTVLSPSALISPGRRTGTFRLGKDQLLTNAQGKSEISLEDYAMAMIDELERPQHTRTRFTVGY